MTERAVLEDVLDDGETLLLADGRRLSLRRADSIIASIWLPPARLMLRRRKGASDIGVTNDETGETVSARAAAK